MIVYANEIEITGANPALPVIRGINGWIAEKLGRKFSLRETITQGELTGGTPRSWLRIDRANGENFKIYSWVLKHNDPKVIGRQWITELGLKTENQGYVYFSCVVYTEDKSTLVLNPVQASQPRVVRYIFDNVKKSTDVSFSKESIGSSVKKSGVDKYSYISLLSEINNTTRKYPIVLISPTNDGNYLVDIEKLQNILFGLAQVVAIDKNFNSYEMEENLGREFSAWAGAINIIRPHHNDGRIFTQLILYKDFPSDLRSPSERLGFLLGTVCHNTNIPRQKNRIRPEGVRTLAARQRLAKRISNLANTPDTELRDELAMVYEEVSSLNNRLDSFQKEKESLEFSILEYEDRIQDMEKEARSKSYRNSQRSDVQGVQNEDKDVFTHLINIVTNPKGPSPEDCLRIISEMYPEKIIVLPTGIESSQQVASFSQGMRLLHMLNRLVTEYLPKFLDGGDTLARTTFTNNEFAARESDTVVNSKHYRAYRKFSFESSEIEMLKHLKVGVADNPKSTIRVHFEVDQINKRLLIGHCGIHLPLPGK